MLFSPGSKTAENSLFDSEVIGASIPRSRSIDQTPKVPVVSLALSKKARRVSGEIRTLLYTPGGPIVPSRRPVRSNQTRRFTSPWDWNASVPVGDNANDAANVVKK